MSFTDYQRADETSLTDRLTLRTDDGGWVTGKVIELALLGDDMTDIRITLQLDNGTTLRFDRKPDTQLIYEIF
jgi:hypothetical protein